MSAALGERPVLVVEDNNDHALLLAILLRARGYRTIPYSSGAEALAMLDQIDPCVVIVDLAMPGMDGFEVARRIRQRPDGHRFSLIAATGHDSSDYRQSSVAAGFDLYLVKPVNPDHLVEAIEEQSARLTTA